MSSRTRWIRGLIAAALTLALGCPAVAMAHRSASSRVHNMRHIAQSVYGEVCDVGTMNVPIRRGPMPAAHPEWVAFFNHGPGDELPYNDCSITVKDQPWETEYLCRVIAGHEFGHAAGLQHIADSSSIMWPGWLGLWQPCADGAAEPRRAPPQHIPRKQPVRPGRTHTRPLVLLLPGGGFQHADPRTMDPWIQDFQKHGIRARAINYPLRSVLAAIEHVRRIAAAEPRPVVAYGISAGGTIAAALAATGDIAGAVNIAGPTDFTRWVTPAGITIMHQIGMTTREQQRAASPYRMLAGHQAPQLVQCGLADPLVTWDQCQRYAAAAFKGQPDTRLMSMLNAHAQSPRDRNIAREWIHARWP